MGPRPFRRGNSLHTSHHLKYRGLLVRFTQHRSPSRSSPCLHIITRPKSASKNASAASLRYHHRTSRVGSDTRGSEPVPPRPCRHLWLLSGECITIPAISRRVHTSVCPCAESASVRVWILLLTSADRVSVRHRLSHQARRRGYPSFRSSAGQCGTSASSISMALSAPSQNFPNALSVTGCTPWASRDRFLAVR